MQQFIGSSTEKGNKRENQDQFFIHSLGNYYLLAIFDGHGENGLKAAQFTKNKILELLIKDLGETLKQPEEGFLKLYKRVDEMLREAGEVDTYISGTTGTLVVLNKEKLWIAHSGDSRVVLGKKTKEGHIKSLQLTNDHHCDVEAEKERLIKSGAQLNPLWTEEHGYIGPIRIFKESMPYPGLAVSRTFGDDVAKRLGVIVDPEIMEYKLNPEDERLIIACDGVWDGLSNDQVIQILFQEQNATSASLKITKESLKALNKLEMDDNTTNICVFLNQLS